MVRFIIVNNNCKIYIIIRLLHDYLIRVFNDENNCIDTKGSNE